MRQVGVLCAAALYALEHNRARLAEDHDNAARFAQGIAALPGIVLDLRSVQTNIVVFDVTALSAAELVRRTAALGLRVNAIAPQRLRAVTHLDVAAPDMAAAVSIVARALREG
jgi:threonine aldolase